MTSQRKQCAQCNSGFEITDSDYQFLEKISPTFAGTKFQIPAPSLCPDCRQQRRLCFRNERNLYRRKCDASGKDIVAMYSPDKPYKVFDHKIWRSDDWDPLKYAKDFDYTKTFTEQFHQLMLDVPHMSLSVDNTENSDYTNFVLDSKSCYLLYGGGKNEGVLFSDFVNNSVYCIDCSFSANCELCYELINCDGCFACQYCINCTNCSNCIGCSDCFGCKFCINCTDLENAEYCIDNKVVGREVYSDYIISLKKSSDLYRKSNNENNIGSEDVSGSNIINSSSCHHCNDVANGQDLKYCHFVPNARSCYDLDFMAPFGSEYGYELCTSTGTKYSISTYLTRLSSKVYYCYECRSCEDCFGCVGLRNKQYCIFNQQYSKEEYEAVVGAITGHMQTTGEWGEFFHPSLSPFGYNETVAQEYYPLWRVGATHRVVLGQNGNEIGGCGGVSSLQSNLFKRSDYVAPTPQVDKLIKGADLAGTQNGFDLVGEIASLGINVLKVAILCEVSNKPFRILPQELGFYHKHNLPLPSKHPDVRHRERMYLRNG